MRVILVASILMLSGCYIKVTEENVDSLSDSDLCSSYAASAAKGRPISRKEISKRKLLTQEDLRHVDNRTIRAGMPECGLLAMIGYPKPPSWCGTINTSGGTYGTRKQYVYRPCGSYGSTKYVYVKNGFIESWQNW